MAGKGHFETTRPVLKVDHAVIDHPVGGGIYLDTNAGFTSDSGPLAIRGAADFPIAIEMMSLGTIPAFSGSQNAHDDALVIGPNDNVTADLTISARMPVRIRIGSLVVAPPASGAGLPVTLTLQPGAELRFDPLPGPQPGARMVFGTVGNGLANRVGRLMAVGTAAQPIRFTSGAAAPAPGDWSGLQLLTADGSQLAFVVVEYAGGFSGVSSNNCRPTGTADAAAIIVGSDSFAPSGSMIVSSTIRSNAGFGIDAVWQNAKYDDPNLAGSSSLNTFTGNGGCNQTYNGCLPQTCLCPTGGGCQPQ